MRRLPLMVLVLTTVLACSSRDERMTETDAGVDAEAMRDAGMNCSVDGCGPGFMCDMMTNECIPGPCSMVGCPDGQMCNTGTDMCEPETTDCGATGCPAGLSCNIVTGRCTDGPGCSVDVLITQSGACQVGTTDCITSGTSPDICVAGDANPVTCGNCIENNHWACANGGGCQDLWNAVACCRDTMCDGTFDGPCRTGICVVELTAFEECVMPIAASTCTEIAECSR